MSTKIVDELVERALRQSQQTLSEYDSKRVLAAYGIPVSDEELVRDPSDADRVATDLGYPVAVKACAPDLPHKTELRVVHLGVSTSEGLGNAISAIEDAVGDAPIDGFLVQRMVPGKREIIVGAIRDATFGPCVMLGLGGIQVEAVGDVSFRLAPLDERDAFEMTNDLRAHAIFGPFRGEPPVDRTALSGILMAAGRILIDHERISQIDINPLIIGDGRPIAVDALVTLVSDSSDGE